jgi:hypothetical protein
MFMNLLGGLMIIIQIIILGDATDVIEGGQKLQDN